MSLITWIDIWTDSSTVTKICPNENSKVGRFSSDETPGIIASEVQSNPRTLPNFFLRYTVCVMFSFIYYCGEDSREDALLADLRPPIWGKNRVQTVLLSGTNGVLVALEPNHQ